MSTTQRHFSIQAADGPTYYVIGDIITIKLTAQETDSAYFVAEVVSQPGGGPAFLHTHEPQETFHVVEGVFDGTPQPNAAEIDDYKWVSVPSLVDDVNRFPERYTPWFPILLQRSF